MLVLGYTLLELVDMVEAIRTGWRREFLGYSVIGSNIVGVAVILRRYSHSDTTLYILLAILHTKYAGWRQDDFNVHT